LFTRRQFSVRLGYSLSHNKSQGSTLEKVLVDTRTHSFAHGQVYVAASRTRNFQSLGFLYEPPGEKEIGVKPYFVSFCLQKALRHGYLDENVAAYPPYQPVPLPEGENGCESENEDEEEAPRRRKQAPRVKGEVILKKAMFLPNSFSLQKRRETTHELVKHHYIVPQPSLFPPAGSFSPTELAVSMPPPENPRVATAEATASSPVAAPTSGIPAPSRAPVAPPVRSAIGPSNVSSGGNPNSHLGFEYSKHIPCSECLLDMNDGMCQKCYNKMTNIWFEERMAEQSRGNPEITDDDPFPDEPIS
jgi:hypothetical protein